MEVQSISDSQTLLRVPSWFHDEVHKWNQRVIKIDDTLWTFLPDIEAMSSCDCAEVLTAGEVLKVHTPSKYADKPYREVVCLSKNAVEQLLSGSQYDDCREWCEHNFELMGNVMPVVCYEHPEVKSIRAKRRLGDCATLAISAATGLSYKKVYNELTYRMAWSASNGSVEDPEHSAIYDNLAGKTAFDGVPYFIAVSYLEKIGWQVKEGCHNFPFQKKYFPKKGTEIVVLEHHMSCVIDQQMYDMWDSSKGGTAIVKDIWIEK